MADAFARSGTVTAGTPHSRATVAPWDGKDGELPEEEPLDAYDDVELDA